MDQVDRVDPEQDQRPFWMSNPMDWQPIDRFILLASLVLLAPGCFGIALLWANWVAPEYFYTPLLNALFLLYATHILLLGGYRNWLGGCSGESLSLSSQIPAIQCVNLPQLQPY